MRGQIRQLLDARRPLEVSEALSPDALTSFAREHCSTLQAGDAAAAEGKEEL